MLPYYIISKHEIKQLILLYNKLNDDLNNNASIELTAKSIHIYIKSRSDDEVIGETKVIRCLAAFHLIRKRLMAISFLEIFQHLDLPIMLLDEGIIIGKLATEIILDEYKRYKENIQSNEYYGFCCYTRCIYELPCRHIIAQKAINSENGLFLAVSDINPTYYFYSYQIMQNKAVDIISDEIRKSEPIWNRTSIIAHFMSLTNEIIRCTEIKEKLLNFFHIVTLSSCL